jgi:endonuclease/exonuclease/phosphatase family metal-dependent hydrolase
MGELRVMTWNVQNLLPVRHESGPKTQRELNAKIRALASVIDAAEPHVLGVQEVGDDDIVARLQAALAHSMPHRRLGVPDGRGIRVGFLSTRVIREPRNVTFFPFGLLPIQVGDNPFGSAGPPTMDGMGRGALQITIRANGRDVRVLNCHLKSKLLSFPDGRFHPRDENERARFGSYALFRRASEATSLRTWITDQLDDRGDEDPFVLLGDMNDEVEAATTQILNGPTGSEIGTVGFDRPDRGDPQRMFNLAPLIPEDERFSRVFRGRGELIDHVFASRFLVTGGRTTSVRTLRPGGDPLPSMTDDPNDVEAHDGSDHAAILATFDF